MIKKAFARAQRLKIFKHMNKILVTGISGFLGWYAARQLKGQFELHGIYHQNPVQMPDVHLHQLDLCDAAATRQLLNRIRPAVILHLAANSNLNHCESHPQRAYRINVAATQQLVALAEKLDIYLLYTSTDMVFDGQSPPYHEASPPSPIHSYGHTKAAAEQAVVQSLASVAVVRLPLLYGQVPHASNFYSSWLAHFQKGEPIRAFMDEFRNPLSGRQAAEGLALLLDKKVKGIWHLGGKEYCSRYRFAVSMAHQYGYPEELVIPGKQADISSLAKRPAKLCLAFEKAAAAGFEPGGIAEELEYLKN